MKLRKDRTMSKYQLSMHEEKIFVDSVSAELEHEKQRGAKMPNFFTYEKTCQEYLDNANDYEKHWIADYYQKMGRVPHNGLTQLRNAYGTHIINDNYDAYLVGQRSVHGDFDIDKVKRDEHGQLVSVDYVVHSDRWACMSDDPRKRDKTHKVTVLV